MKTIKTATKITKGDIITAQSGRRYTALSSKPWAMNTHHGDNDPNLCIMVRPIHVGKSFDLVITQGMINRGAYSVTREAK